MPKSSLLQIVGLELTTLVVIDTDYISSCNHTVRTVLKYNRQIVQTQSISLTYKYQTLYRHVNKSGGFKLILCAQTYLILTSRSYPSEF